MPKRSSADSSCDTRRASARQRTSIARSRSRVATAARRGYQTRASGDMEEMMGITPIRALVIALLLAAPAAAQRPEGGYGDEGTFSLKPGIGFTAGPDTLLLGFEGDYRIADPVSVGLLTEVGIDDDITIVSPQLFARYWPNLGELIDPDVAFIEPYVHLGIGFTWWDADVYKGVDDDDTQFLLSPGFGVDFRINETVSV